MKKVVGVILVVAMVAGSVGEAQSACTGDCDASGDVTIDEIVRGVGIALGTTSLSQCTVLDASGDGQVTIDEVIAAVSAALSGCPTGQPTPTPTPTVQPATPTQSSGGPTPAPGCSGAYFTTNFANPSGVNVNQPLDTTLYQTKGSGNLDFIGIANLGTFGANASNCPIPVRGIPRIVRVGAANAGRIVAGTTFALNASSAPGLPPNILNYAEATAGPSLQTWIADSGTLTIDSIDGSTVTFHASGHMVPGPAYPFGPPAMGTFDLTVSGTVTVTMTDL